jgi:hypothetical protein
MTKRKETHKKPNRKINPKNSLLPKQKITLPKPELLLHLRKNQQPFSQRRQGVPLSPLRRKENPKQTTLISSFAPLRENKGLLSSMEL